MTDQGQHPIYIGWHSVKEVADELRVSRFVVVSLIHRGELAAIRVGREYRVKADDIAIYLANQREASAR